MSRGKQKIENQRKNQERQAALKGGKSQLAERANCARVTCPICMAPLSHASQVAPHYQARHPKETVPAEFAQQ
ncbi:hypothetical protein PAPYR_5330 [Paratrimastix pyriformis]|uniref:C2H2-type domain-containing protein n=1 Tax=Paratrimastix pyriformis TaxID=342808 RepID=A0ABQ8UK60_9EUKA|nr:hypothetical protein PAPYR_5330 [Paratrimastix pyriformis]